MKRDDIQQIDLHIYTETDQYAIRSQKGDYGIHSVSVYKANDDYVLREIVHASTDKFMTDIEELIEIANEFIETKE